MSARPFVSGRGFAWSLRGATVAGLLALAGAASAQTAAAPLPSDANGVTREMSSAGAQLEFSLALRFGASPSDSPDALTEYVHVPGSAFVPMHSASGVEYSPWGCMYMTGPESASNFAVVVPDGSTVTYLRLYFYDVSATHDGIMQFAQYNDGVNGTYLDTLQTSGSGGDGTVTHTGLSIPIDYVNYSYVLYWDVPAAAGSQLQLCGFRVGYVQPRIFVDGFESGDTAAWSSAVP